MTEPRLPPDAMKRLKWPLRLTLAGLVAEHAARAFWPSVTAAMMLAAVLLSGGLALWPGWLGTAVVAGLGLALLATLVRGIRRFLPATWEMARDRLDATLSGAPIAALADTQAIGADDPASRAVWEAHRARAAARLDGARAPAPRADLARRDPYALRLVAATALAAALLFGAGTRPGDLAALVPGSAEAAIADTSWEGWIEPPAYTGKPTLYLADQPTGALAVPVGSRVTLRLYGRVGALDVVESYSDAPPAEPSPTRAFTIDGDGLIQVGDDRWEIAAMPDKAPRIQPAGELTRMLDGEMRLPFAAHDDYGVAAGSAEIGLDLPRVDRRYGLVADPEPRAPIVVDLPMPYRGDRAEIEEQLIENLAAHPWAELPVTLTLTAVDAAGQAGQSAPMEITLPGRRFLHPLARALIEQRRDLLWSTANAPRAARLLRAISNRPDCVFPEHAQYLRLRAAIAAIEEPALAAARRDEVADELWALATEIDDGALADALEALRRARERLAEAMRQGATPEELQQLMDEYRQAMRDYMQELAKRDPENRTDEPDQGNQMEMTQADLQALMDRIEELMQQGRMDEAQQLLDMLQQMRENMQLTEGASGQQGQSPGEQALDGLSDTLRQQQGLSDEAFRNLQRQRGQPGQQPGQQQGQQPGQQQGDGQGQDGQPGDRQGQDGQPGDQPFQPGQPGDRPGGNPGTEQGDPSLGDQNLADRQRALEDELRRQRDGLPEAGTPEGDAAREALDRAGRAMEDAAEALERGDTSGALDRQAEAMEALREGMRNLEDGMRREAQNRQPGDQGTLGGQPQDRRRADPLGRTPGDTGTLADDGPLADRADVYRRAQELMEELRRRSGETDRPELERDYLKRLLDLF